jgi:methylmalonyl-CoA/ethylmalonyl-CoA epimerase
MSFLKSTTMFGEDLHGLARIHHVGLAVRDFGGSVNFFRTIGYRCCPPVVDPIQGVELVMCESDWSTHVELVKPLTASSPVTRMLKESESQLYHICFLVQDLPTTLDFLKRQHRVIRVRPPEPAVLFEGRLVSFYFVKGIGLVEFLVDQTAESRIHSSSCAPNGSHSD